MASGVYFFGTADDLLTVVCAVEARRPLKYVAFGSRESAQEVSFPSVTELVDFGVARLGDSNQEAGFLVTDRHMSVVPREIRQRRGGRRFAFDQLANPWTVVFRPGGLFSSTALVGGEISTSSSHEISKALFQALSKELKCRFKKVKSFLVGVEAEKLSRQGVRLTTSIKSPETYDLRID
jgi:hypothetical protein